MDAWVVEALRVGYRIPFDRRPPLSERPLSLPAYSPQSIKGVALTQELQTLLRKGAVEPAPQSPGFYSRLFLVQKASGSWRPIIDLSTLNDYITSSHFHMEAPQSVLRSIRPGDWMVSRDLQDAYLQVPVHHDSRRYLRFVVAGKSYQFRVLCFSLTTAPKVFTRIMAPVSAILHRYGVRMLRYLDDWLILASTELACLQSRDRLLSICTELGIHANHTKSSLVPNPLPRSVIVPSLSDFAGDLPERVQCPVRAIKFLRKAARSASYIPSRLFVSPRNLERAMSKNAMSFYLRQLIVDSGAVSTSRPPRAHDIRGIATLLNYYSNLSLSNLMQVATWKSNRVFASRYLKEVSATQDNIRQFGPLVIAGDRLHPRPPQHKQ